MKIHSFVGKKKSHFDTMILFHMIVTGDFFEELKEITPQNHTLKFEDLTA